MAPTVWHGVIQSAFTKALEPRDGGIMSRFHDYCQFRCIIEGARSNAPLTLDERRQYRERCAEFLTPTFDALYKQFMQTSSISSTDVDAAAFPRVCSVSTRWVAVTIRNARTGRQAAHRHRPAITAIEIRCATLVER